VRQIKHLLVAATVFTLTSCSGLQVQRDLKHADLSQSYRASLSSAVEFNSEQHCKIQGVMNSWTALEFIETTPIVKLPNGTSAAAVCIDIPAGARVVEMHAHAKGGMTFHELTVVHPSLQFLDDKYQLVKDVQKPRLSPGDTFFSGLGLSGNSVLTSDLSSARHVLVYVHPLSLEGAIDVQTGYESIPVPYGPYGPVKIRFR